MYLRNSRLHRTGQEAQKHRDTTIIQGITDLHLPTMQGFSGPVLTSSNTSFGDHNRSCMESSQFTRTIPVPLDSSIPKLEMDTACQDIYGSTRDGPLAGDMEITDMTNSHRYQPSPPVMVSVFNDLTPEVPAWRKHVVDYHSALLRSFFGTISMHSKASLLKSNYSDEDSVCGKELHESMTELSLFPSQWLIKLGFHYGLHLGLAKSTIRGWKFRPSLFYPVADDALIFEFCRQGNISGVRTLFSKGKASVWDTDSLGRTALHVSYCAT